MRGFSIAGTLGGLAVFAVGLAALVSATNVWAGTVPILVLGLLLGGVLGAILRGWQGGGWLGFAVFGWGCLLTGSFARTDDRLGYAASVAGEWVFSRANPAPIPVARRGSNGPQSPEYEAYALSARAYPERFLNAGPIGLWLSVLIFAEVGSVLGMVLARKRGPDSISPPVNRTSQ